MEKCGKMPLRDTFRVGLTISADCITLTANNDTCLLAMNECATGEIPCVHQSSIGWEDGVECRLAPIGGWSAEACPHGSEKQAEVAGHTAMETRPTP